jgi:hypothetical protein
MGDIGTYMVPKSSPSIEKKYDILYMAFNGRLISLPLGDLQIENWLGCRTKV